MPHSRRGRRPRPGLRRRVWRRFCTIVQPEATAHGPPGSYLDALFQRIAIPGILSPEIVCRIHGKCLKNTTHFQLQRVKRLDNLVQFLPQNHRTGEQDQDVHITVRSRLSPGFGPVQDNPAQTVPVDGLETGLDTCQERTRVKWRFHVTHGVADLLRRGRSWRPVSRAWRYCSAVAPSSIPRSRAFCCTSYTLRSSSSAVCEKVSRPSASRLNAYCLRSSVEPLPQGGGLVGAFLAAPQLRQLQDAL